MPWIRTCQECGHLQVEVRPSLAKELSDSYRDRSCNKCGSSGLDYGRELTYDQILDGVERK